MTATDARGPLPAMVRGGLCATVLVGLPVCLGLGLTRGPTAAINAAGATALIAAVFASGVLALAALLGTGDPRRTSSTAMIGAFVVYGGQLLALTALALALHGQPWIDRTSVAIAGLSAVVAWQVGQIVGFARSRTLIYALKPAELGR